MQFTAVIIALVILGAVAVASAFMKVKPATPDTPIKSVRRNAKRWTHFSGCLRDAKLEDWKCGVLITGEIVDVKRRKKTGKKFVRFPKRKDTK